MDVTLCLDRLNRDEPRELVIGLQWLGSTTRAHTSRAAPRVLALTRHEDETVREGAKRTAERFGAPWV